MKINEVKLENFKFHKELSFNIENQNCLICGENGTGKSSIYWSLVSVFKNDLVNIYDFKNRNFSKGSEFNVTVKLDDNTTMTLKDKNELTQKNQNTIYFAHQDMLEEFITYSDNFFDVLNEKIKEHFKSIYDFSINLDKFNQETNVENHEEQVPKRVELTKEYEEFLKNIIDKANEIINNDFNEDFKINFEYDWGELNLNSDDYNFIKPNIILKIDNQDKLKLNFNEAKLKLVSIALFFAFIKLEENEENPLKLLVLDDFLTSLDMANRKLIVQFILDNFKEYQKIILTHNIQFYNLIIKLLKIKNEDQKWDIKNIFLIEDDAISFVKTKNTNYLDVARSQLLNGEYYSSGNALRKEFERILNEFKQILEIGKQEQLKQLIDILKSVNAENNFYKKPFSVLNKLSKRYRNIEKILDDNDNDNAKIGKVTYEIKEINQLLDNEKCELSNLKDLLNKIEFYKDIVFNPASHSNDEIEIYRKECISSIKLLRELNDIVVSLK